MAGGAVVVDRHLEPNSAFAVQGGVAYLVCVGGQVRSFRE